MQKPQSWRDLLKELIRDAQVRQRIIAELEINPITSNRRIQGESKPRSRSIRRRKLQGKASHLMGVMASRRC